jgi:hypothetical protein
MSSPIRSLSRDKARLLLVRENMRVHGWWVLPYCDPRMRRSSPPYPTPGQQDRRPAYGTHTARQQAAKLFNNIRLQLEFKYSSLLMYYY